MVFTDTSGDGVPDAWALRFGLNPYEENAAQILNSSGVSVLQAYNDKLDPRTLAPDEEWAVGAVGSSPVPEEPSADQPPLPESPSSFTLSWTAPGTRLDGSSISLSEIEAYEIMYGRSEDALLERIEVSSSPTAYTFNGLELGLWYFAVRARDTTGLWSPKSNVVVREIK